MKAFIEQRADPYILHLNGWYYFTASVPAFDRIVLRCARTLRELPEAEEKTIWVREAEGPLSCNIWAPELHRVGEQWVFYFAAAPGGADPEGCFDHRIYALVCQGEDPMEGSWLPPRRIQTGWESFSLDATTVAFKGQRYFIWAQRDRAIPGNSNLYIARMLDAVTLDLPGVRLSVPEYDWECQGFLVNEGPGCLIHDGNLFVTYSGSATDERYAVGLLTLRAGRNPLDPAAWEKSPKPVMVTEAHNGLYGPGHNSFTVDEEGADLLVFHARPYPGFVGDALSDPNRHCFLRKVRYDEKGQPVLREK